MNTYKLLTPGPLTTTDTVKQEMLVDRCTWDDDYKAVTQKIRRQLLELAHVSEDDYTAVLMQGQRHLRRGERAHQRGGRPRQGAHLFQRRLRKAYDRHLHPQPHPLSSLCSGLRQGA